MDSGRYGRFGVGEKGQDAGLFTDLARNWRERLERIKPYEPGIPREGYYPPGRSQVEEIGRDFYRNLKGSPAFELPNNYERGLRYLDALLDYRDSATRRLIDEGVPTMSEGLAQFEGMTGVGDYELVEGTKDVVRPVDGATTNLDQFIHETHSHLLPYQRGFMPDYRDFNAGYTRSGEPKIVGANPISPVNESIAADLDNARYRSMRGLPSQLYGPLSGLQGALFGGQNFTGDLSTVLKGELGPLGLDPDSRKLLPTRMDLFYPRYNATAKQIDLGGYPDPTEAFDEAGKAYRLLNQKYAEPSNQRVAGLLRTLLPGLPLQEGSGGGQQDFYAAMRLLDGMERLSGQETKMTDLFYSGVPLNVVKDGMIDLAQNIKKTPSSLLPSVADAIPTTEAVDRFYEEGAKAGAQQLLSDFVQGIPVSLAIAPVLSSPAVAPAAPYIGAGLLANAGLEAVNALVRQETGKDILQRIRETAGAVGGDTSAFGTTRGPVGYDTKPGRAKLQREMARVDNPPEINAIDPQDIQQRPESENFLERRLRLAREARQLDPYDFGITELLFGR